MQTEMLDLEVMNESCRFYLQFIKQKLDSIDIEKTEVIKNLKELVVEDFMHVFLHFARSYQGEMKIQWLQFRIEASTGWDFDEQLIASRIEKVERDHLITYNKLFELKKIKIAERKNKFETLKTSHEIYLEQNPERIEWNSILIQNIMLEGSNGVLCPQCYKPCIFEHEWRMNICEQKVAHPVHRNCQPNKYQDEDDKCRLCTNHDQW